MTEQISITSIEQHRPLNSQICQTWSLSSPSLHAQKQFFHCVYPCIQIQLYLLLTGIMQPHHSPSLPQPKLTISSATQPANMLLTHLHRALHFSCLQSHHFIPSNCIHSSHKFIVSSFYFCPFCHLLNTRRLILIYRKCVSAICFIHIIHFILAVSKGSRIETRPQLCQSLCKPAAERQTLS